MVLIILKTKQFVFDKALKVQGGAIVEHAINLFVQQTLGLLLAHRRIAEPNYTFITNVTKCFTGKGMGETEIPTRIKYEQPNDGTVLTRSCW